MLDWNVSLKWAYLHYIGYILFDLGDEYVSFILLVIINLLIIVGFSVIVAFIVNRKALFVSWNKIVVVLLIQIIGVSITMFILFGAYPWRCALLHGVGQQKCYQQLAGNTKDISWCKGDQICISNAARISEDLSLCDILNNEERRGGCYAWIKKDASFCKGRNRGNCVENIAIATLNFELCKSIGSRIYRNSCYIGVAKGIKDDSICEFIQEEHRKKDCYRYAK